MIAQDKRALWKERIDAWVASGESMRTFAQRNGWPPRQLAWWKTRLTEKPATASGLIPVMVKPSTTISTVRLTGANWTLDLPGAVPAAWLAELLRSL